MTERSSSRSLLRKRRAFPRWQVIIAAAVVRRARVRAVRVLAAVTLTASFAAATVGVPVIVSSGAEAASTGFGPVTEVSGSPGGGGIFTGVDCTGAGDCTAVGKDSNSAPMAANESGGAWGTPTEITAPGSGGEFVSVTCTSSGDCTAVGADHDNEPIVATESGGTWGSATEPPALAGDALTHVTCTSSGDCTAVGTDGDSEPFYVTESDGTWGTPTEIPVPRGAGFNGVSCTGAGDCTAVGTDGDSEPFYVTESDGTWGTPTEIPVPRGGGFNGVSCTGAGDCTAVGNGPGSLLYVTETGGIWNTPTVTSSGPSGSGLVDVSCASPGNCAAVGRNTNEWPFYLMELGGAWGTPTSLRPAGDGGGFSGVSCTGAGDCTAVGNDSYDQPVYSSAVAPPGQAPVITSPVSAVTGMRSPFSFTVATTGYPPAAIAEQGALPTGVTFTDNGDGTATLAGTAAPGTAGTYPIALTASNGVGSPATQSFTLTVTTATSLPAITSASAATETFGEPFSFLVTTTGYPAPRITKTGPLPPGVILTNNGDGTATISGAPSRTAVGVYPVTLTAKNSAGTASQTFALTVTKAPVFKNTPPVTINVGTALHMIITAKGYTIPALTESGTLPAGLNFTDNGNGTATIAGTPTSGSGGRYQIIVTATNQLGTTSQALIVKVNEPPTITSPNTARAAPGSSFSFNVTATGYPAPKITETGTLPKGIALKSGILAGTPKNDTSGTYPITTTATNNSGAATQSFMLSVS
jgi:Putative Ig domain